MTTSIDTITTFLGWCSVINIIILTVSTLLLMTLKKPVMKIHAWFFGVRQEDLPALYLQYLGNFKLAVVLLNITPYIALKIMS